jgi:hypothetical protein
MSPCLMPADGDSKIHFTVPSGVVEHAYGIRRGGDPVPCFACNIDGMPPAAIDGSHGASPTVAHPLRRLVDWVDRLSECWGARRAPTTNASSPSSTLISRGHLAVVARGLAVALLECFFVLPGGHIAPVAIPIAPKLVALCCCLASLHQPPT